MISGSPIEGFSKGWAVMPFIWSRAHYWIEGDPHDAPMIDGKKVRTWVSACGVQTYTAEDAQPLGVGSFLKCKKCGRK